MGKPVLVIHGGAGAREGHHTTFRLYARSLDRIVEDAWQVLCSDGSREAVLHAIRLLEEDPIFNAGLGSRLQKDGHVRMSAALMDGVAGRFSGVVNVEEVEHPIDIAAALADHEHRVLAGPPATDFARNVLEMNVFDPRTPHRLDEHQACATGKTGTVGAVALDADGSIWVGTSTGGVGYEIPGRMSDSATVAGNYANALAGVSCTGKGEHIVDHAAAARVLTRVCDGMSLATAVDKTIAEANRESLDYGLIGLDREGHALAAQTSDMTTLFCIRDDAGRRGFFDS